MDDLIKRKDAIDGVINLWANKPFGNPALVEIKDCIEALPSAERKRGEWIQCSERLPEKDTSVLGYIRCASFDYMDVIWRDDYSGDWTDGDNFHYEVIAWMPLPEPAKGEKMNRGKERG